KREVEWDSARQADREIGAVAVVARAVEVETASLEVERERMPDGAVRADRERSRARVIVVHGAHATGVVAHVDIIEERLDGGGGEIERAGAEVHAESERVRRCTLARHSHGAPPLCVRRRGGHSHEGRSDHNQPKASRVNGHQCWIERGGGVGRRAAATPDTGVGVCQLASDAGGGTCGGGTRPPGARVPPRDVSVAPNPTVTATHVTIAAIRRSTAPSQPAQDSNPPIIQRTKYSESPMNRNCTTGGGAYADTAPRHRMAASPVTYDMARNPSASAPAPPRTNPTMAKGMSRIPMTVIHSATMPTTSAGKSAICPTTP